jgi:hypothetical protein
MNITINAKVDVHVHLDGLAGDPTAIEKELRHMSQELDNLAAQVAATTELEASAITLIQGLASQFAASKDDPAKIQALSDQLKSGADALATALTANTPAAPSAPASPSGS